MRIVQVLPTIAMGDAVGNNCRAIDAILHEAGFDTSIYAQNIDPRLPARTARSINELGRLDDRDVMIYHMSIAFNRNLSEYGGHRIFQYHNVTPPEFFRDYSPQLGMLCENGLREVRSLSDIPELCWADSEFNKQDLRKYGYTCCVHTVPILVPFEDYEKPADKDVIRKYDDDYVNFLFVGRVAPNKAQEDVIRTFAWYQRHINPRCRLFLVGNADMTSYVGRLKRYIKLLGVKNVIFPGHISFSAVLAYYRVADVFLCMSQHEGFCVPLLEAMHFHIPILARNTTAIPYTLGGSGVLLEDNDPIKAALMADRLMTDESFRDAVIAAQDQRLRDFSNEKIKAQILDELKLFS